ncbi:hypothetical protein Droror1_Dr00020626, partial [Drosera rotundifolia]
MIIASTFGTFALLFMYALGGFILSRYQVKKWWIWGYWSSPLMYAQNAIAVNELLGNTYGKHQAMLPDDSENTETERIPELKHYAPGVPLILVGTKL